MGFTFILIVAAALTLIIGLPYLYIRQIKKQVVVKEKELERALAKKELIKLKIYTILDTIWYGIVFCMALALVIICMIWWTWSNPS